jgi:hypothetical protein
MTYSRKEKGNKYNIKLTSLRVLQVGVAGAQRVSDLAFPIPQSDSGFGIARGPWVRPTFTQYYRGCLSLSSVLHGLPSGWDHPLEILLIQSVSSHKTVGG